MHQFFLVMLNLKPKIFRNFFNLPSTLDSKFFSKGVSRHQLFFGHAKFETKNFSEFFPLPSIFDSEFLGGGSRHQLFLVMQNFFPFT